MKRNHVSDRAETQHLVLEENKDNRICEKVEKIFSFGRRYAILASNSVQLCYFYKIWIYFCEKY